MSRARPLLLALALALFCAWPAQARDRCIACHPVSDPRLKEVFLWRAPQAQEELSLCPVLGEAKRELQGLESAIGNLAALLEQKQRERLWTRPLSKNLVELRESFRVVRSRPMVSLSTLAAQTAALRRSLDRLVARPLAQAEARANSRTLFGWGVLMILGAVLLLLFNYQVRLAGKSGRKRK